MKKYQIEVTSFCRPAFRDTDKVKLDYYVACDHNAQFIVTARNAQSAIDLWGAAIGDSPDIDWEQSFLVQPMIGREYFWYKLGENGEMVRDWEA